MSKQTLFRVICRTSSRTLAWFKSEARDHASEMTLPGLTEFSASYGGSKDYVPVAWITAEEEESECMSIERALEVSTAAGRVIEYVNGKYIPRGIEDPELVALQTRPQHVEASCEEEKPVKSLGALLREKLSEMEHPFTRKAPDHEPKRAPLPYFTEAKRFDPFSDFIVHHREEVSVNAKPFANLSLDAPEQFRAPRSI